MERVKPDLKKKLLDSLKRHQLITYFVPYMLEWKQVTKLEYEQSDSGLMITKNPKK